MIAVSPEGTSPLPDPLPVQQSQSPTVLRIMLGSQLRRLRERSHITLEEAGRAIRASHSKISRMELGRVGFRIRDVADLLTLYGVRDSGERDALLSLVPRAKAPGWWHNYDDVLPSWFETYVGLEEAAGGIRNYEVQFVPGLLQTEEYARAVVRLGNADATAEDVERRVRLRMLRQAVLTRPEPPHLWAVVDEAVVRRPLGGRDVMRAQLEHLLELVELPNVTLQVVPFLAGGLTAAGGPFSILRFAEASLPDVVYLEQLTSAVYLDKREDVDRYLLVMDRLCVAAKSASETKDMLRRLVAEL
ncbi:transcriptional regulator [Sphaerimonospora thailandensis]|uniref:Transcriptional regulator n=2 Tax=Sphaerimonospora thailandensis TaxID=795644 RepID=A0A8J3W2M7_9ACTN|nr:transcriptional regulator [Sphaerimonospora thailandensis]